MNPAFTSAAIKAHQRATPAAWDSLCAIISGLGDACQPDKILADWQEPASSELRGDVTVMLNNAARFSGREVVAALKTIQHLQPERRWGTQQLLWTGPAGGALSARRLDQTLYDLISSAKDRILIVSFAAAYVPLLVDHLRNARARGVDIRLILETEAESEGQLAWDASAAFPADLLHSIRVYTWPRHLRESNAAGKPGKLHVKCAVVDDAAIVTSANLTDDAFNRNMELGILSQYGALPAELFQHFAELIASGVLVPRQHFP